MFSSLHRIRVHVPPPPPRRVVTVSPQAHLDLQRRMQSADAEIRRLREECASIIRTAHEERSALRESHELALTAAQSEATRIQEQQAAGFRGEIEMLVDELSRVRGALDAADELIGHLNGQHAAEKASMSAGLQRAARDAVMNDERLGRLEARVSEQGAQLEVLQMQVSESRISEEHAPLGSPLPGLQMRRGSPRHQGDHTQRIHAFDPSLRQPLLGSHAHRSDSTPEPKQRHMQHIPAPPPLVIGRSCNSTTVASQTNVTFGSALATSVTLASPVGRQAEATSPTSSFTDSDTDSDTETEREEHEDDIDARAWREQRPAPEPLREKASLREIRRCARELRQQSSTGNQVTVAFSLSPNPSPSPSLGPSLSPSPSLSPNFSPPALIAPFARRDPAQPSRPPVSLQQLCDDIEEEIEVRIHPDPEGGEVGAQEESEGASGGSDGDSDSDAESCPHVDSPRPFAFAPQYSARKSSVRLPLHGSVTLARFVSLARANFELDSPPASPVARVGDRADASRGAGTELESVSDESDTYSDDTFESEGDEADDVSGRVSGAPSPPLVDVSERVYSVSDPSLGLCTRVAVVECLRVMMGGCEKQPPAAILVKQAEQQEAAAAAAATPMEACGQSQLTHTDSTGLQEDRGARAGQETSTARSSSDESSGSEWQVV